MTTAFLPETLPEALDILSSNLAIPVAGGTDLMVRHRRHAALPVLLEKPPLFVSSLSELRGMKSGPAGLEIGAAVTLSELAAHSDTPVGMRMALAEFAAPAIRNAATIGGNLCNASPAADTLPFLYTADALVKVASSREERTVPVAEFITGPGQTLLADDELVISILIPASVVMPAPASGGLNGADGDSVFRYYRKVAPRRSNALSKLSVYAEALREDGGIAWFRLALGAVAPTVIRRPDAEDLIRGATAAQLAERAEEVALRFGDSLAPIDDQRSRALYRGNTAMRLIRDILLEKLPAYLEPA